MKGYKDLITEARELATENISQPTVFYKDKSQRIMLRLCDALEKALTELDRLTEAQRWIPTSERLPTATDADVFQDVEAMDSAGRMNVWYWGYVNSDNPQITHWRELPEPPKGE